MAASKPVIAAFDFDETLITHDSLPDFLRHSFSLPVFAWKTFLCAPMLVRFKLRKITNQTAKEHLLTVFLGGMSIEHFDALCQRYATRLNNITRKEALERVQWHQQRGDTVAIISASPESWIAPWAKQHGIGQIISTKLETVGGKLTGKLATPNCHGAEKVNRFLAKHPDRNTYELYMYGDGKSDQQMFTLADHAFEGTFS